MIKIIKSSNILFQYINFFKVMFRQVLFKKPLLALSTDVNYQKLPQGNFDMTAAFNNKKLLSLLFKQQIIQ